MTAPAVALAVFFAALATMAAREWWRAEKREQAALLQLRQREKAADWWQRVAERACEMWPSTRQLQQAPTHRFAPPAALPPGEPTFPGVPATERNTPVPEAIPEHVPSDDYWRITRDERGGLRGIVGPDGEERVFESLGAPTRPNRIVGG